MRYLIIVLVFFASALHAVEPSEMLADPALEERARVISKDLRCLVCQNESIDDSNASLAKDLRVLVRERLVKGDTDEEVKDFLVMRYGEFVLLRPRMTLQNMVLWLSGPIMLFLAAVMAVFYVRRRGAVQEPVVAALSEDEKAELEKILRD
jgi:cytochrome c-type biogenesis protein CcmH